MLLHKRIKKIRNKRGYSQENVCRGIISLSHYSNIETGRYFPSAETIKLLANRLNVPVKYFLNTNKEDPILDELLVEYEQKIDYESCENLNLFFSENEEKFKFISSFKQELSFYLLRFLHLIKHEDIPQAVVLFNECIKGSYEITFPTGIKLYQDFLYVTGLNCYYVKKYVDSVKYFKMLLEINIDISLRAKTFYNIALAFFRMYQYNEALNYAKEANENFLRIHNWDKTGDCYNFIAVLLRLLKRQSESEKYIKKGFHISTSESYKLRANLNHNLSLIKKDEGDYEDALIYIDKSLELKKQLNDSSLFISYIVKLNIYLLKEEILSFNRTLTIAQKHIKSKLDEAHFLFVKAKCEYLLENNILYEQLISKSINMSKDIEDWNCLKLATEHFSNYLEENKKYKKAFTQQKLCTLALENIYTEKIVEL